MEIPVLYGPIVAIIAFALLAAGCALPFAVIEATSGSTTVKASYGFLNLCLETGGTSVCATGDTGCDALDGARKAGAAFAILSAIASFAAAAYGALRSFVPTMNNAQGKVVFSGLCGGTALFSLIAGSLGVALFSSKWCDVSVSDVSGAAIGAGPILIWVGFVLIIASVGVDMMLNQGGGGGARKADDHFSGGANANKDYHNANNTGSAMLML